MNEARCPEPLDLMIWLDQEAEYPELITEHLRHCPHCQSLVEEWRGEKQSLAQCLESVNCPDFTGKVMAGIMTASSDTKLLYNVLWCILLTMTTLSAALIYYLALPWWQADSLAVAGVKIYSVFTSLFFTVDQISTFIMAKALTGRPLLPALCVSAAILLLHLYSKRRYSHA